VEGSIHGLIYGTLQAFV